MKINLSLSFFILFLGLVKPLLGQKKTSNDAIYLEANYNNIENFKEVYLDNFVFSNATFDLNFLFQPEAKYEPYENLNGRGFLNGNVKEVHEFLKSKYNDTKILKSTTYYTAEGLKTEKHEIVGSGNSILTIFEYDVAKRLIKSTRIVGKDTINSIHYKYNNKNQIIEYVLKNNVYKIDFDKMGRPIEIKKPNSYKLYYDRNTVKINEYSTKENKLLATKIYTYSENKKLIKEVSLNNLAFNTDAPMNYENFYSYNSNGKLIRIVVFLNKMFNRETKYEYNEYDDVVKGITTWKNNVIDYQTNSYDYDEKQNKIYEHRVSDISKTDVETFYEMIYY